MKRTPPRQSQPDDSSQPNDSRGVRAPSPGYQSYSIEICTINTIPGTHGTQIYQVPLGTPKR